MKKLESLWKQRMILWKKYQAAVWIEVIFLCIMAVCSGCLYWIEKNNQLANSQKAMKTIQTDIYNKAVKGASVDEIRRLAVEDMLDTVDEEGDVTYGISLKFYSSIGNTKNEITDKHLSFVWRINTEEGIQSEWYALEDYFSEEELEGFFRYYTENDTAAGGRTGCYIQKISGFYNGQVYKPIEVVFGDWNNEDEIYVLQNEERVRQISESRLVYRVANITQDELDEPDKTETGYFSMYLYDQRGSLYQKASQIITVEGSDIVNGNIDNNYIEGNKSLWQKQILGSSEMSGYSCAIYADTSAMVKNSPNLRKVIPPILIFAQILAIFLIWVYLYIQKKQHKLANMRNTFINAIAHEMKTPAAVIKNSTECLLAGIHPEKQEHYIKMIGQEADHMNELLNSMLIYTRVTDSVYRLQKEECMLEKIAQDVCRHYTDALEKKEISLIWDKNEPVMVNCDMKLMEMVLDNLVSNAIKFCNAGGVIRISLVEQSISLYNEGKEIPEADMEHIWEPMYKGDESRTYENGSSGMGLAISEAILKMHGADYGVKNVSGGVEFYLRMR